MPAQTFKDPLAAIVGTAGNADAFTTTGAEALLQPAVVTEKFPEFETVIALVVAPFDHRYEDDCDAVRITLPPGQNAIEPEAVTVGEGDADIVLTADVEKQPGPL